MTKSPGRIPGTKLSSKISRVGKTSSNSNQIPAGASNAKGSNQVNFGRHLGTVGIPPVGFI